MIVSDQNRIFFGYNGNALGEKNAGDSLQWTLSPALRTPLPYKDELIKTAELISSAAEAAGRIPTVLLSGGLDSEAVVMSFLELGRRFKTASFSYTRNELHHETEFIDRFVARMKLDHRYIERDWFTWIQAAEARELYYSSDSSVSSMLPHLKLMSEIHDDGGVPILGGGTQYVCQTPDGWELVHEEQLCTPTVKHSLRTGMLAMPLFFQYTPELLLSFLSDPIIERALDPSNRSARIMKNLTTLRYAMYRKAWPHLEARMKFTQFERRAKFYIRVQERFDAGRELKFDDKWSMPILEVLSTLRTGLGV